MDWKEVAVIVFRAIVRIGKVLLGLKGGDKDE